VVDKWLKTPQDEQIPLMKHMFDFTIRAVLSAVYDCDDHRLINSVHESYKIVSLLLASLSLSLSMLCASSVSSLVIKSFDPPPPLKPNVIYLPSCTILSSLVSAHARLRTPNCLLGYLLFFSLIHSQTRNFDVRKICQKTQFQRKDVR